MMLENSQSLFSLPAWHLEKGLWCVYGYFGQMGLTELHWRILLFGTRRLRNGGDAVSTLHRFYSGFWNANKKNGINKQNPTKPMQSKI